MKPLAERMRASPLVQAWKLVKLFGLAWLLVAVMTQRLCLSHVYGSLTVIACWNPCELGCSLLLWCCFEQRKTWDNVSRQDKLFLVWGLQQTLALISSEFGYHWRSILRVCGLIQVFVWVEKRGSSNLLGVALQPRGMVRGIVLLSSPKRIKRLLVFYSSSERENRGRKSSESYIQR